MKYKELIASLKCHPFKKIHSYPKSLLCKTNQNEEQSAILAYYLTSAISRNHIRDSNSSQSWKLTEIFRCIIKNYISLEGIRIFYIF